MSFTDRFGHNYKQIRNIYGAEALCFARRLERILLSQIWHKQHLHYLHRCKESRILPRFLLSHIWPDQPVPLQTRTIDKGIQGDKS